MIGSQLAFSPTISRGQYIRDLFNPERTRFLLARRSRPSAEADANAILDALVAWDETQKDANTHQLSVRYNERLDGAR